MYQYTPIKEQLENSLTGKYTTYGITLVDPFSDCIIDTISDVSLDESFINSLAELFTTHQLQPCHFTDCILDAI